jgi:hypothetical protein
MLDPKSSFGPAVKAAEKQLLKVLGDLEVRCFVMPGMPPFTARGVLSHKV